MDNINSHQVGGDHYASKSVQPWDAMEAWMTPEAFSGYLLGNCIKYLSRYREKNGTQDLKKCEHYLAKLIEVEIRLDLVVTSPDSFDTHQYQHGYFCGLRNMSSDQPYHTMSKDWQRGYNQGRCESVSNGHDK